LILIEETIIELTAAADFTGGALLAAALGFSAAFGALFFATSFAFIPFGTPGI
jgi:hypothetical protein